MTGHRHVTITTKGGKCECGERFKGTPSEVGAAWEAHTEVVLLLEQARNNVHAERMHREAGENTIRALTERGVSARKIAESIGRDPSGTLLVSPTLVLRLSRAEHVKTPRRRRRA